MSGTREIMMSTFPSASERPISFDFRRRLRCPHLLWLGYTTGLELYQRLLILLTLRGSSAHLSLVALKGQYREMVYWPFHRIQDWEKGFKYFLFWSKFGCVFGECAKIFQQLQRVHILTIEDGIIQQSLKRTKCNQIFSPPTQGNIIAYFPYALNKLNLALSQKILAQHEKI